MKKTSLLITMVAAFSLYAKAQAPNATAVDTAKKAENPNAAEMTFSFEQFDYGTIKNGSDGTCEFKFKNTGKDPLVITDAHGSCGCTVPTWPKDPIMKGETSSIKVHYDTKRTGAFTKTVTINSNSKTNPKVLTIKGVVEAPAAETTDGIPLKKTSGSPLEMSK
jgi:hypothetical protein